MEENDKKRDIGSMPGYQIDGLIAIIGSDNLVVEIGSYRGVSARKLALAGNTVICIDPFKGNYDASKVSKELLEENTVKSDFLKNTKGLSVTLIEDYSHNVINDFAGSIFKVLIIDGEHTYKGVKKDIEWKKYLTTDGIIAFHDVGLKQFPGIKKAVDEFAAENPEYKLIKSICTLKVYKKDLT